jgi:excisionase family DNA binding protein
MVTETKGALRPAEAAAWLSSSLPTITRLIRDGRIRSFTIGRARYITLAELQRFLAQREAEEN